MRSPWDEACADHPATAELAPSGASRTVIP
jgi:hypothetical protein